MAAAVAAAAGVIRADDHHVVAFDKSKRDRYILWWNLLLCCSVDSIVIVIFWHAAHNQLWWFLLPFLLLLCNLYVSYIVFSIALIINPRPFPQESQKDGNRTDKKEIGQEKAELDVDMNEAKKPEKAKEDEKTEEEIPKLYKKEIRQEKAKLNVDSDEEKKSETPKDDKSGEEETQKLEAKQLAERVVKVLDDYERKLKKAKKTNQRLKSSLKKEKEKNGDDISEIGELVYGFLFFIERIAMGLVMFSCISSDPPLCGSILPAATVIFVLSNSIYLLFSEAMWQHHQEPKDKKEIRQEEAKLDVDLNKGKNPRKAEGEKGEEEIEKLEARKWAEKATDFKEKLEIMQATYNEAESERGRLAHRLFDCERDLKKYKDNVKLLRKKQIEKNEEDGLNWKEERSQLVAKLLPPPAA